MKIRVGQIPYLNSEVFYYDLVDDDIELAPLVPRALSDAAIGGMVDAGPIPLVTCFDLEDQFLPLGGYCIATGKKAHSILLFSKRPIKELSGAVVGITNETSTSVLLLKTLLTQRYHLEALNYAPLGGTNDAYLLIGDEALKGRNGMASHPYRYDLGQEWHSWTGLPFVFARWLARRGLDISVVEKLITLLGKSIEKGLADTEKITESRRDIGMPREELMEYVLSFRYHLGSEELKSIDLFRTLLKKELRQTVTPKETK